jgi:hypothetical protein
LAPLSRQNKNLKLITLNIAKIIQYKKPQKCIAKTPPRAANILHLIFKEIFKKYPIRKIAKTRPSMYPKR